MLTFKNYMEHSSTEDSDESDMHVSSKNFTISGFVLIPGDIYYTRKDDPSILHRENGPAIIGKDAIVWVIEGELRRDGLPTIILKNDRVEIHSKHNIYFKSLTDLQKWIALEQDVRCVKVINRLTEIMQEYVVREDPELIIYIEEPTKKVQEYIIQKRPDLIDKIKNLDPELKEKYRDELNLVKVDI